MFGLLLLLLLLLADLLFNFLEIACVLLEETNHIHLPVLEG